MKSRGQNAPNSLMLDSTLSLCTGDKALVSSLQDMVQETNEKAMNAFQVLMAGGREFPPKKTSSKQSAAAKSSNRVSASQNVKNYVTVH